MQYYNYNHVIQVFASFVTSTARRAEKLFLLQQRGNVSARQILARPLRRPKVWGVLLYLGHPMSNWSKWSSVISANGSKVFARACSTLSNVGCVTMAASSNGERLMGLTANSSWFGKPYWSHSSVSHLWLSQVWPLRHKSYWSHLHCHMCECRCDL